MSENSKIEWTDHSFNPWEGCQKVGPGCDHCYAETRNARFGGGTAVNWGPGAPRRRTSAANWRKPLAWNRDAGVFYAQHGRRQRVFCASLADVFDNAVDPAWRADLFDLIYATPNLDWLLLTKRIGNVPRMLVGAGMPGRLPSNVWLGATIVNQSEADRDIPKLLAVHARVRFLSMEPLLGPVNLKDISITGRPMDIMLPLAGLTWTVTSTGTRCTTSHPKVDWVIVGGESGPGARPMHRDWARSLREQCAEAGVPFLFKQWGEWCESDDSGQGAWVAADGRGHCDIESGEALEMMQRAVNGETGTTWRLMTRVGKARAGRRLDGVQHDGYPEVQA